MSIVSLDGVIAGMQPPQYLTKAATGTIVAGRPHSLFYTAGVPGAGSAPAASLNGSVHNAPLAGCFSFVNDAAKQYLARFAATSHAQGGLLLLCDRLWSNGGINITSTGAQAITSPAWPARDNAGSTSGDGVLLGVEVSATTGSATPTLTVGYTNQAGTAGKTGTNTVGTNASAPAGSFFPIGLAAGDRGVRSVQSLTLSASWVSGTIHLVAYRVVTALELVAGGIGNAVDAITGGMPELFDDSCLWPVFIPSTSLTTQISGQFIQTNG
jgi:hypothetical protein